MTPDAARAYTTATNEPPALRSLVNEYVNDPVLGVFARQALIARSTPQADVTAASDILSDAIVAVTSGGVSVQNALQQAESRMTQLLRSINRVQ